MPSGPVEESQPSLGVLALGGVVTMCPGQPELLDLAGEAFGSRFGCGGDEFVDAGPSEHGYQRCDVLGRDVAATEHGERGGNRVRDGCNVASATRLSL